MALKQRLNELSKSPGAPWLALVAAFVVLIVIWIGYIIDAQGITDVAVP